MIETKQFGLVSSFYIELHIFLILATEMKQYSVVGRSDGRVRDTSMFFPHVP